MAAVTPTEADIRMVSADTGVRVRLGETCTAGEWVYLNTGDDRYWQTDATDSAKAQVAGFLMTGGDAGDYATMANVIGQEVDVGATLTVGEIYVLSSTKGAIEPEADSSSGDYISIAGVGVTGGNLKLTLFSSGAQVP